MIFCKRDLEFLPAGLVLADLLGFCLPILIESLIS